MDPLAELSSLLWRIRNHVELLAYRVQIEELVLGAGRAELLPVAVSEALAALEAVRSLEADLAEALRAAADAVGLDPDADVTLSAVAEAAGDEWGVALREHQLSLQDRMATVHRSATAAAELSAQGHAATEELLAAAFGGAPASGANDGYSPEGAGTSFAVSRPRVIRTV